MSIQCEVKQGDTLQIEGQMVQDDGTPIDITTAVVTAQIRDASGMLVNNGVAAVSTPNPAKGGLTLSWQSDSTWPVGLVCLDILYVQGALRIHSDTMSVMVEREITQ